MRDKKYIIELGHADYEDEDLSVDGRRVFEGLSDKVPSLCDVPNGTCKMLIGIEKYQIFAYIIYG